ncbi:flagellar assembly peptidoglycan hydrolase FlgJ [Pantoea sp. Acro-805]|uniref:Peptidoglycan hydrolase FlgJ n=1 Tax=Candidatus Pantoea formicae TaxID=2608355 RepID=A0ABX0QZS5_9GAMM|nr:flagellar assembly peptidoglycan hydrolase FlgJ [Pantoea formicae]NIF01180.1 flagellar assembly peptidoglycan hydrolase FlgJ [Pantoea formicae]
MTIQNQPAFDLRSLDALKREAKRASPEALRAAAQQMEGIFVQMMMKSMRDATFKDELMHSASSDMFMAMHDQQVAQEVARSGQLGFAELIVQQAGGGSGGARGSVSPRHSASAPLRLPAPFASPLATESNHPFIARLLPSAQKIAQQTGLHPHLIVAQAALESGWGVREIPAADGSPSHNLFGIKATAGWRGKTSEITTSEYINGVKQQVKAVFRVYDSYEQGLRDYAALLLNNPRYRLVVGASSAEQGASALQAGGYATDPAYADKLISLIKKVKATLQQRSSAYQSDLTKIF